MTSGATGRAPRVACGLVLAALALLPACNAFGPEPNFSFERMLIQQRYDPYEDAGIFPDGAAMRVPPAGAVPRERLLGPIALVSGRDGGHWVERIPLAIDTARLARGRDRFAIYCAACHGPNGDGESPVARSMTLRKPPSLFSERVRALAPGRVFAVVGAGYGMMPGYGGVLDVEDRWAVVAFVEALQLSRRVPLDELPEALRREARAALDAEAQR